MKRFLERAFAVVVTALAFNASAEYLLVMVDEGTPGAFSKKVGGREFWFTTLDDATKYEIGYDSSWWYTPEKSNVTTTPANIKKPDGTSFGEIDITTTDTPETLETKIRNKLKQHSVEVAYSAAAVALAKAMWSELQAKVMREQIETMAKTMQANLLNIDTSDFYTFTDDNGTKFKCLNDNGLSKAEGTGNTVSQLKTLRDMLGTTAGEDITITKAHLLREGIGSLGGGGGSTDTDAITITNLYTDVHGKPVTNLAFVGWWKYGDKEKPQANKIPAFDLADIGKEPSERGASFNKHHLLARSENGELHYVTMTNQVKVTVMPDIVSINTNVDGSVTLYGFTNTTADVSTALAELLKEPQDGPLYTMKSNINVLVRFREKEGEGTLYYMPLGDIILKDPDMKSVGICMFGPSSNKLEIAGFAAATNTPGQTAVGDAFSDKMFAANAANIKVPVKQGDSLAWLTLGNYDINEKAAGLTAVASSNAQGIVERKFELANWSLVTNQAASAYSSIADIIGKGGSAASTNLMVLAKNLTTEKLEYILLGDMSVGVDGESIISTNKVDETTGKTNTVHGIYGFREAGEGKVPMKVKVAGAQGEPDTYKLVWTNMQAAAIGVDDISVEHYFRDTEDTNGVHMVKGFVSKEPYANKTLGDLLNADTDEDDADDDNTYQVLTRIKKPGATYGSTNGFELAYFDIKQGLMSTNWKKKVTGPEHYNGGGQNQNYMNPSATNNQAVTGLAINQSRLVDSNSIGTNGNALAQLRGFDAADPYTSPFKTYTDDGQGGSKKVLEWRKMGFADGEATAFGAIIGKTSIEANQYETPDGEGTWKGFSIYGFGTAAGQSIPSVELTSGTAPSRTVKWIGTDGVVTNDGTRLTLQGFSAAQAESVPHKNENGGLTWKPAEGGGGGALKFIGTDNSYVIVGEGSTTNEVKFASEGDSRVTVKMSQPDSQEGVTITIGVYYR